MRIHSSALMASLVGALTLSACSPAQNWRDVALEGTPLKVQLPCKPDRTTRIGDVCNKIGTYLKALAAVDNGVPFYVALPASTIDWTIGDGVAEIPIEARNPGEVTAIQGRWPSGPAAASAVEPSTAGIVSVQLTPDGSPGFNPAFDVTPARLVTALITERGMCSASEEGLRGLYAGAKENN